MYDVICALRAILTFLAITYGQGERRTWRFCCTWPQAFAIYDVDEPVDVVTRKKTYFPTGTT